MKKRFWLIPLLLTGIFVALQYGCEGDNAGEVCDKFSPPEGCNATEEAMVCCDDNRCYYVYQGVEYPNTEDGIDDLLDDMCDDDFDTKGCVLILKERTKELLKEARECAGCN